MRGPRSLRARVALASAGAAALAGAVAAIVAGWTAEELVRAHDDDALLAHARTLADEVDDEEREAEEDGERAELDAILADELDELPVLDARVVVHDGEGQALGGDRDLAVLPVGSCDDAGALRACTVALGARRLTLAASEGAARDHRSLLVIALLAGALVGALAGGVAASRIARVALAPLGALRDRVRAIDPGAPRVDRIATPEHDAELEDLRAAIAELVERLAIALTQARSFASNAAHELRTPLAHVAGELELLTERSDREALERTRAQVARLVELVQRLLVLARAEPIDRAHAEAVDLGDVAREVVARAGAPSRVRLALEDDVIVAGDAALLEALVSNALSNALKFSDDLVDLEVSRAGDEARIEVRDRGPGIADEDRARVFDAFYRSRAARASGTPGHGIGLALIAHVATAHGGRVELVPSERGVHLRVLLPRWSPRR
ncbi:sensor histidine kinase [Sandaracinus amylolyticus]|uniref:histidine kinase n=1 Tax=Sandaracinus amylolyticus TaxID=927083 RepID=A0A0F6YIX8_9BACT|nr:HAMP domain-containing sensor histidine kinase [Sandaracinus amylolyticus]AKF07485.1 periplasmic sensor signal transduction histidine kinase [Sandaracinus amylolyticus]